MFKTQSTTCSEKPLDATSIDSAKLDIDAISEVGGEDWKVLIFAPEQHRACKMVCRMINVSRSGFAEQQAEPDQRRELGAQDNLTESSNSRDKQYMTIDELMARWARRWRCY